MQFRDLEKQYQVLKKDIDMAISKVLNEANFISGRQVNQIEESLANYVGVKHCITCANGTDALLIALMAWGIKQGDCVFVPDFTFFASAEVVSAMGATPVFVDVDKDTFNISTQSLEKAIEVVLKENKLNPKVIITVDLFGQPANYPEIKKIAEKYNLLILEDGAQGFGGKIGDKKACSFGDISATSFFPAKPLGCYGDGGAIFTDNTEIAELIRSLAVHGKGSDKYDNVRIGMNSRLDTIQAAILKVKLEAFKNYELARVNHVANLYSEKLKNIVKTPYVIDEFYSSWAQYTIQLENKQKRDDLQKFLKNNNIPSMIYYAKPMHLQKAFETNKNNIVDLSVTEKLCDTVISLPMHPYMTEDEIVSIVSVLDKYFNI